MVSTRKILLMFGKNIPPEEPSTRGVSAELPRELKSQSKATGENLTKLKV